MMGYHEEYGHLPSRVHTAGGHRTFKDRRTWAGCVTCRLILSAEHRGLVLLQKSWSPTLPLGHDRVASGRWPAQGRLLLPAHDETEKARLWPLLYLSHGSCDSYVSWTRSTDIEQLAQRSDIIVVIPEGGKELVTLANCDPKNIIGDTRKVVQMFTLFSRRAAGLASITASGALASFFYA
jgi:poly(3-hydroxybutyrate) depolymerase